MSDPVAEAEACTFDLPRCMARATTGACTCVDGAEAEAARIVAWLTDKEGAWRKWSREWQGVGAAHIPRLLGEAISRGDHRKETGNG